MKQITICLLLIVALGAIGCSGSTVKDQPEKFDAAKVTEAKDAPLNQPNDPR